MPDFGYDACPVCGFEVNSPGMRVPDEEACTRHGGRAWGMDKIAEQHDDVLSRANRAACQFIHRGELAAEEAS